MGTNAQTNVSVALTESDITTKAEVLSPLFVAGTLVVPLLGTNIYVNMNSTTATLPATTSGTFSPLELYTLRIKPNSIGLINIGGNAEIVLTMAAQPIFYSLLNVLGGDIRINYRIITSGYPWLAGKFATPILITTTVGSVTNPTQNLEIVVPGFITLNTFPTTTSTMHITTMSQFRNAAGISTSTVNDYSTTVPTLVNLKSNNASFTLLPLYTTVPSVAPVATTLQATIADPSGPVITVTNSDKLLTTAAGIPVIADNKRAVTTNYTISKANLYSSFATAGKYTLPMTYTISKPTAAYPVTLASKTVINTLELTVDNITEITLPVAAVSLSFNNQNDFVSGVSTDVANQINLSSTVPYNVTVRASASNFTSTGGSVIPVNVVTIEGMAGQSGIIPVNLSTTAQPIITAGSPEIDKVLNLKYSIPAAKIPTDVLGKPQGNYTVNIIYSLVAP